MNIEIISIEANKINLMRGGIKTGKIVDSYTIIAIVIVDKTKIEMNINTRNIIDSFHDAKEFINLMFNK